MDTDKRKNSLRKLRVPVLDFMFHFFPYVWVRLRGMVIYVIAAGEFALNSFATLKLAFVSRIFWGRGGLYKNLFHYLVVLFTVVGLLGGVFSRLSVQANEEALTISYGSGATSDFMQQGGSIQTVLESDPLAPQVPIKVHRVVAGDTLDALAAKYEVSKDTIHWANMSFMSPFTDDLTIGWELKIPTVNGVLYKVEPGDSLDSVVASFSHSKVYRDDIIELNGLVPPAYQLEAGRLIFIPNGELPVSAIKVTGIPMGVFKNPLSHPSCVGYRISRGFTSYHNGVDLARYPGCPIRAIAAGEVIFAGWSSMAGYNVRIDHGGGIVSHYYHGEAGGIYVQKGDRVQQGQEIMMMGTTGNSTGVHLHISLFKDNYAVDPQAYIPF